MDDLVVKLITDGGGTALLGLLLWWTLKENGRRESEQRVSGERREERLITALDNLAPAVRGQTGAIDRLCEKVEEGFKR